MKFAIVPQMNVIILRAPGRGLFSDNFVYWTRGVTMNYKMNFNIVFIHSLFTYGGTR